MPIPATSPHPPLPIAVSSERRQISANIFWLLGEKLLRMGVSFTIIGLVARHLGPEAFGTLNYAAGLVILFSALATLGLDLVVVRALVRTPDDTAEILGTAFVLRAGGGVLAMAALAVCAPLLAAGSASLRTLVAITSMGLVWQAFDVIDLWFQKNLRSRHTVAAKLIALVAGGGLKLWLVAQGAPVEWFCWSFVADGLFFALAIVLVFRAQGGRFTAWRFSAAVARSLLTTAWPLVTSGLLISLYLRLDQIFVLRLTGPRELGYYTAASKVAEVWIAVSAFVLTSVFPVLVARRERGAAPFQRDLQFAFDVVTGLGYAFAVLVSLAAPVLVPLVFGQSYAPASPVLTVLVWSAPILFSSGLRAHYFMLEGATIYHNWAALLGIVANTGLALWLIPQLGASGAAWAVVASSALSGWGSSYLFAPLRTCGRLQTRALLLPFRPRAWREITRQLR